MSTVNPRRPSRRFPGLLVVLEGIDGCGSTTQARLLAHAIERRGTTARLTCEPSAGPVGSLIRQALSRQPFRSNGTDSRGFDWSTLALLFAADRMDHLAATVVPALEAGSVVVSDRYDLSSLAYQSATAQAGVDAVPWIRQLNAHALRPDLTIVIDVPAELAEERRRTRGGPEELFEARELQARLATLYSCAEELVPGDRLVHVSGVGDSAQVASRIERLVDAEVLGSIDEF